jgi:hypothetical protein
MLWRTAMPPIINCEPLKKYLSVLWGKKKQENWIKGDNQLCSNFILQFVYIWLGFHPAVDTKLFTKSKLHFFQMFPYIHCHSLVLLNHFTVVYFQVLSHMIKSDSVWYLDMNNDFWKANCSGTTLRHYWQLQWWTFAS